MKPLAGLSLAAALAAAIAVQQTHAEPAAADPAQIAAGKKVFDAQCSLCHSVTPGEAGQGPELNGVVGRAIGVIDFPYSDALKKRGSAPWSVADLDAYLADPQATAPGTSMPIRMADPAQRAALIAYLATTR